jgi:Isochorismatase family
MAPLLQPADCSVLVVDARMHHVGRLEPARHRALTQDLTLLLHATHAAAVPMHLSFVGAVPQSDEWIVSAPAAQIHALGASGSCWSGVDWHAVLAAENRTSLILGGFWLETTLTFLALPALASGFEVFILMDVAPSRADIAARSAADRLLHAGAVPITTSQLVAEWAEASSDPDVRSALSVLSPRE